MSVTAPPLPENPLVRPKQRIPGEVKAMGGHRHEAKKTHDITNKSILELKDLIARHESILKNKRLCGTLPDKGEKVREKLVAAKVTIYSKNAYSQLLIFRINAHM